MSLDAAAATPLPHPLRKYLNIFRVSLIERMAYRGDFLLGSVLRFLPLVTSILLWKAVYSGASETTGTEVEQIDGYTYNQMIAYLLLVHISRMFSSMPGLATGVARDIRDGNLKKYLIQPLDMIGYLVSYRAAHKTAYITTSFIPYAILFILCYSFFDTFPTDPLVILAYAASLILGFVIGFFFEITVGMLGFWMMEVTSLLFVITTVTFFLSGHMFPVDLLWWPIPQILKFLPFNYLAYFPAAIFLGKVQGWDLVYGLLMEAGWAVFLIVLCRVVYRRGLRRYSAFGG